MGNAEAVIFFAPADGHVIVETALGTSTIFVEKTKRYEIRFEMVTPKKDEEARRNAELEGRQYYVAEPCPLCGHTERDTVTRKCRKCRHNEKGKRRAERSRKHR